jgi:hypothetical protein
MSTIGTLFEINGVISTDKSVMQNINTLCTSAGAWMTYDIAEGRWSVVINRAGASISSFNDSNIIGGINISGTGVNELYNSATIEYPHKDLRDQTDYIDLEIPSADRFPYELDNRLNIKLDCINNPVTAQYLASVELKQSRIDKVIQFRTDYSKIGLKAGDIIDVTNSVYGYTAKKFRITKVEEEDTEGLAISITALEYDENVYSTDGLIRKIREKKTGILPKDANNNLSDKDLEGDASKGYMISATAGTQNFIKPMLANHATTGDVGQFNFVAPYTAKYVAQVLIDVNSSGCQGYRYVDTATEYDLMNFQVYIFEVGSSSDLGVESSGDEGARFWDDFFMNLSFNLIKGRTYTFKLRYKYYAPRQPGIPINLNLGWNIYTIKP